MATTYLHGKSVNNNGEFHSFWTKEVEIIEKPTKNKRMPVTGYCKNIPTNYMVKFNGRWRRGFVGYRIYQGASFSSAKPISEYCGMK